MWSDPDPRIRNILLDSEPDPNLVNKFKLEEKIPVCRHRRKGTISDKIKFKREKNFYEFEFVV